MSEIGLNPYLYYGGNCRDAMEFYHTLFGGQLTLRTYAEGPPEQIPGSKSNGWPDKIMHARLEGDFLLMARDDPDESRPGKFTLCLRSKDADKIRTIFEGLSQKGTITTPLHKQPWGDELGEVTDAFGIRWMVSILTREN